MAKYDRLKKCKCNGCPLSVDVVTERDGNGVCQFHSAAVPSQWMPVRDRIVEHQAFLGLTQKMNRLALRYRARNNESVNDWLARVNKQLRPIILEIECSSTAAESMQHLKDLLKVNH